MCPRNLIGAEYTMSFSYAQAAAIVVVATLLLGLGPYLGTTRQLDS